MRPLFSVLALLATISIAAARPSTLDMTCEEAAAMVRQQGEAVLSTGTFTFDRFVVTKGYCLLGDYAERGFAPTSDEKRCLIGYVCKPLFDNDD